MGGCKFKVLSIENTELSQIPFFSPGEGQNVTVPAVGEVFFFFPNVCLPRPFSFFSSFFLNVKMY